ncbi:hypothetical protein PsYK624_048460 [Phanerochaete sordida]|uniref:Nephrocystin 3-like N-terminal domain-containing protein n=1 Tax=Phanerochaete sordida TaxID=48140 RepID=A0A9P3G5Q4_9APHY|nr:hypothetical protein PsYK624_048460 [Phanerochaete sordida]
MTGEDRTGAALSALGSILSIAEDALSLTPVPWLPLVASTLKTAVERVELVRENQEGRKQFLQDAKALADMIEKAVAEAQKETAKYSDDEKSRQELVDRVKKDGSLQGDAEKLHSAIEELAKRADDLKGGRGFLGFLKGLIHASHNKAVLDKMNKDLSSALEFFKVSNLTTPQISIHSMVEQVRNHLREMQETKSVESIPWTSAGYRSVDELKSGFTEGTRDELFVQLHQWQSGAFPEIGAKRFYLGTGSAGLGKSSIAHQLCVRTEKDKVLTLGASFFFMRGGGDLESSRLFFTTVAHQLALSRPALRPFIVSAANAHLQYGQKQQMKYAYQELLHKPLAAARDAAAEATPVRTLLVVDGIDECKDHRLIPDLLRYLLELVRDFTWLYIFATSRPEQYITDVLASPAFKELGYHHALDDTSNSSDDVKRYLEAEVPKTSGYADLLKKNPNAIEELAKRTGGKFIFARTAVNYLSSGPNRADERLEHVLTPGGSTSPTEALDVLYLQILRGAFPPDQLSASPEQQRLSSFLRFVAVAHEPVSPETMAFLDPRLSVEKIKAMVERLRAVVTIVKNGCVVALHDSFPEFLVDAYRCTDPAYYVDAPAGHAYLASLCLDAITFSNVTELLAASRKPGQAAHRASLQYILPGGWWTHLQQAEFNADLESRVLKLAKGEQLAMIIWIVGDDKSVVKPIWSYLQRSRHEEATLAGLFKFAAYVQRWLSASTPRDASSITTKEVSDHLRKTYKSDAPFSPPDTNVDSNDLQLYQGVMEKLETSINQDATAQGVWRDRLALAKISARLQ